MTQIQYTNTNNDKLIHTEHRSNKVGFTMNVLLCQKCFLQEHSPERLDDS